MRFISEWIEQFHELRFQKPDEWGKNLRPCADPLAVFEMPYAVDEAILQARTALLGRQRPHEGYWSAPILGGDITVECDTIMLLVYLGHTQSPKIQELARTILAHQLPDGGWPIYEQGPADLSATVKAYWALKLAGHSPDQPALMLARTRIDQLGGIHRVNTFTKFYLALFGLYDWRGVPAIPPELILLPSWSPFNIHEMSAWTRSIVMPLSIIWAKRPEVTCPVIGRLDELFPDARRWMPLRQAMGRPPVCSWSTFFLCCDRMLKSLEGHGPHWLRAWALRTAEHWILERLRDSDGLGAIFPGIVNAILAMLCLGYSEDDPLVQQQFHHLRALETRSEPGMLSVQPCHSPIWDTAISIIGLAESGLDGKHPALVKAGEWLLAQEIRQPGDWCAKNPAGPVGGWPFQFHNAFYPDIDDTAMVILSLRHVDLDATKARLKERACLRGLHWLLSMQSRNGGWAAFDKNNTRALLTKMPFADHNAMIDPPTADITGRILELLGYIGYDLTYPCVQRAVQFLRAEQESDGSWFGRWGVNYLYGTWQVLRGLRAVGLPVTDDCLRRAVHWLESAQLPNGGWGETCGTYRDPSLKGRGPATPSQTAWALMGLMAGGSVDSPFVQRGVEYLLVTQRADGTWEETGCTGTGFPLVYYLTYTLYRLYFPLMALGTYRKEAAHLLKQ